MPPGSEAAPQQTASAGPGGQAWVYVLRCGDGSLYTGWSNDVPRRLARHREGRASRYTASRLPVELVLALPMADRSAAMREEARIKALRRPAKLELIAGHHARAGGPRAESGLRARATRGRGPRARAGPVSDP